jgi:hypothetical protein
MLEVIDSNREMTELTEISLLRSAGTALLRSNQDEDSRKKKLKVEFKNTEINGVKTMLEKKVGSYIRKSSELWSARKKEDL